MGRGCVLLHAAAFRRRHVCCAESAKILSHFWERGWAVFGQPEVLGSVKTASAGLSLFVKAPHLRSLLTPELCWVAAGLPLSW